MLDYHLFKKINELFAAGRFQDARQLLMELQSRVIALRDEMEMLNLRIHTLEDAMQLSQSLYTKNGAYWIATPGVHQGPFCISCYENTGSLIRLEHFTGRLCCPCCYASPPLREPIQISDAVHARHARIIPFAK